MAVKEAKLLLEFPNSLHRVPQDRLIINETIRSAHEREEVESFFCRDAWHQTCSATDKANKPNMTATRALSIN